MAKKKVENQKINNPLRSFLLDIVFDHTKDELESVDDIMELAKENEYQLLDRIINILDYYRENYNS